MYTVAYMTDVSRRLLQANLFLKKNTIIPHIQATKKMIEGDRDLLNKIFLADEFDILNDREMEFTNILEEYKILIGYDDIQLLQQFEFILYSNRISRTRANFNDFVKQQLKSEHSFMSKSQSEQIDILKIYWDYLDKINHEKDRTIAFVLYIFKPQISKYIKRREFLTYRKDNIKEELKNMNDLSVQYRDLIPSLDFFEKMHRGGIHNLA